MGAGSSVASVQVEVTEAQYRTLAGLLRASLASLDDVPSQANAVDVLRSFVDNARSLSDVLRWDGARKGAVEEGAYLSARVIETLRLLMARHPLSEDVQHHAIWIAWFLAEKSPAYLHTIAESDITALVLEAMGAHCASNSVVFQSAKLLSSLLVHCADSAVRALCAKGMMRTLADTMMRHADDAADVQAACAECVASAAYRRTCALRKASCERVDKWLDFNGIEERYLPAETAASAFLYVSPLTKFKTAVRAVIANRAMAALAPIDAKRRKFDSQSQLRGQRTKQFDAGLSREQHSARVLSPPRAAAAAVPESRLAGWGAPPPRAAHPSDERLRETIATAALASLGKATLLQPAAYAYVLIECCATALERHGEDAELVHWCGHAINNLASFARLCAVAQIERRVEKRVERRDAVAGGDSEVMERLAEQAEHDAALALGNIAICHLMPTLPLLVAAMERHAARGHCQRACAHACAYVLKSTTNDVDGDGEADDDALLYLAPNFCTKLIARAAAALKAFPGREEVQFNGLEMLSALLDGHCTIDLSSRAYEAKVAAEKEAARQHAEAVAAAEAAAAAERRAAVAAKMAAAEKRRLRRAHDRELARRRKEQEEAEAARLAFARKEAEEFLAEERRRRLAVEGGEPGYLISTSWTPLDPEIPAEEEADLEETEGDAAAEERAEENEGVAREGAAAEEKEGEVAGDAEATGADAAVGGAGGAVAPEGAQGSEAGEEREAVAPTTDASWLAVGGGEAAAASAGGAAALAAPGGEEEEGDEEEGEEERLLREGKIAEALATLLDSGPKKVPLTATLAQTMKAKAAKAKAEAEAGKAQALEDARNDSSLCGKVRPHIVFNPKEVALLPLIAAALRNHTENAAVQHMASKALHALVRGCPTNAAEITRFEAGSVMNDNLVSMVCESMRLNHDRLLEHDELDEMATEHENMAQVRAALLSVSCRRSQQGGGVARAALTYGAGSRCAPLPCPSHPRRSPPLSRTGVPARWPSLCDTAASPRVSSARPECCRSSPRRCGGTRTTRRATTAPRARSPRLCSSTATTARARSTPASFRSSTCGSPAPPRRAARWSTRPKRSTSPPPSQAARRRRRASPWRGRCGRRRRAPLAIAMRRSLGRRCDAARTPY